MNCPGNQKVSQIKIQVPLHVPDGCNAAAYYADMGHTFLESYSQDQFFQMSVQGVGTSTWWLQGSVRLKENVRLRSARSRVRKILLDCHSRHVLNTELNTKFGEYLASELKVTSDAAQLSGNSHWWTPSSLREQSSTLAVPAAALSGPRTVDVVPGPAAPSARAPGAPTWAFNCHRGGGGPPTCADGCRHPVASSSGASPYGGSGLRHLAPAMPAIAPALPAASRQTVDVLRRPGGGGSGLQAPAMPAIAPAPAPPAVTVAAATDPSPATPPRAGALGRGRQRPTPPKDPASESPAHKRVRPGAGAETPAMAKGLDFGPTPAPAAAHPAREPVSTVEPLPLRRNLDFEPAAGAGAAGSECAHPAPSTPPRPTDRRRERESDGTPSSSQGRPRKKREEPEAAAPPHPTARQGLSFPFEPSDGWRGFSIMLYVTFRVPDNRMGVQAAIAAIRNKIVGFVDSHDGGCVAVGQIHDRGINIKISGMKEQIGGREVQELLEKQIKKKLHNCMGSVGKGPRSTSLRVQQCKFGVRISGYTVVHARQVLAQIAEPTLGSPGFKLWRSRLPTPPAPAPPTVTGAVSVSADQAAPIAYSPAPAAVARALAVDSGNLRSQFEQTLCSTSDLRSGLENALDLIAILGSYLRELRDLPPSSPAPAAGSGWPAPFPALPVAGDSLQRCGPGQVPAGDSLQRCGPGQVPRQRPRHLSRASPARRPARRAGHHRPSAAEDLNAQAEAAAAAAAAAALPPPPADSAGGAAAAAVAAAGAGGRGLCEPDSAVAAAAAISAEYLVDGSRVEGRFDRGWYPGILARTSTGRTGFTVRYDDGDRHFYTPGQARTDLRHAVTKEDPDTTFWNITHDLLRTLKGKNSRFCLVGVLCPLKSEPLSVPAAYTELLNSIVRRQCESPECKQKIIRFLHAHAEQRKAKDKQWTGRVQQFLSSVLAVGHEPGPPTGAAASAAAEAGSLTASVSDSDAPTMTDAAGAAASAAPAVTVAVAMEGAAEAGSPHTGRGAAGAADSDSPTMAIAMFDYLSESDGTEDANYPSDANITKVEEAASDVEVKRKRGERGETKASKRPRAQGPGTDSKRQRDNSCQEGGGGGGKRLSVAPASTPSLPAVCQCCGTAPEGYEIALCTWTSGLGKNKIGCSTRFCGSCAGHAKNGPRAAAPLAARPHLCERHRACLDAPPTMEFSGNWCLECGSKDPGLTKCTRAGCGKTLCDHHFQKPTNKRYFPSRLPNAGWCRHCHGTNLAGFEKPREMAANSLFKAVLGWTGHSEDSDVMSTVSGWTLDTFKVKLSRQRTSSTPRQWKDTCELAEDYGMFIYALICCGLGALAGRLMRPLMLMAMAFHALDVSMLLPQNVFYMISSDPWKLAGGPTLASVLRAFGRNILSQEEERKRKRGALQFPDFDVDAVKANAKIHIALAVFDALRSAPTPDLIFGLLMGLLKNPAVKAFLVVRTTLTKKQLAEGNAKPYDTFVPSAVLLAEAFGDNIRYICADTTDEEVVPILRELKLNVLIHINGYNHGHFWKSLNMAMVAEMYIEWLSLAALLMCWQLAHWVIASKELVTKAQLDDPDRDAILYIEFPYPSEAYYLQRILAKGSRPPRTGTPAIFYAGGISRLTIEDDVLEAVTDALHRASSASGGRRIIFYIQEHPASKVLEIIKRVREYCEEKGYDDLSLWVVGVPFFTNKEDYLIFMWEHPELVAIAADPVNPHTGCMDAALARVPVVCWWTILSEWHARMAREMNITLGLGDELNVETRDAFTEKLVTLLLVPARLEAISNHMGREQEMGRGVFDDTRVLRAIVASIPPMLAEVRKSSPGTRQRLPDIDSAEFMQGQDSAGSPKFILTDWQSISRMGDNVSMERSKIMQSLIGRGCHLDDNAKGALEAILGYAQQHMSLHHLAGLGAARAVVVGVLKQPVTQFAESRLGWRAGSERWIALNMDTEGLDDNALHNSETLRQEQILLECDLALHRANVMKECLVKPVKCLRMSSQSAECTASAAFYRRGKGKVYIFGFFQDDVGGLSCFDAVPKLWSEYGQVDNTTRLFVRGLCHMLNYTNNVAGMAQLHCAFQDFAEVQPRLAFPGICRMLLDALPGPAQVQMRAWGKCVRIGTSGERKDRQARSLAVSPAPLQRLSTQIGSQGNAASRSGPALLRVTGNFGVLDKATITKLAVHRKETAEGVGRPRGGNPAHSCPLLEYVYGQATGDERLDPDLALLSQSYSVGSVLYHDIFCQRKRGQTMEQVRAEKEKACQSPEAMLQTMKSRVPFGVKVQQEAMLYANLMWNLMRTGNTRPGTAAIADKVEELKNIVAELKATRIPVRDILRHPVLTNLTFSEKQAVAVQGDGLPIGGVSLPAGCTFESDGARQVPIWKVKPDGPNGSWGNGAFADQDIAKGQFAALYVGLDFSMDTGRDVDQLAPGNHNVTIFDGSTAKGTCVGELPLEVLQVVGGVGVFFNAKTTHAGANLALNRRRCWRDGKGLVYIPMYATRDIQKGEGGYWDYDPFAGAGGADSYTFDNSIFEIHSNVRDA